MVSLILFEIIAPLSAILLQMEIDFLSITSFGLYYQKKMSFYFFLNYLCLKLSDI